MRESRWLICAIMSEDPKDDYYDAVMLDYYRDKKDFDALF